MIAAVAGLKHFVCGFDPALQPRAAKPPPEAFEPGKAGDKARETFGRAYTEMMRREWFSIGIHLGYRYECSPLIVPDGSPEPPDTVTSYDQTARPGHRAPHAWLDDGRSTLDLFTRGFALLCLGDDPPVARAFIDAAKNVRLPLETIAIPTPEIASLYEARLALVRPDGMVCWRAYAPPSDLGGVINAVRGAA